MFISVMIWNCQCTSVFYRALRFVSISLLAAISSACAIAPSIPRSAYSNIAIKKEQSADYWRLHKYTRAWVDPSATYWIGSNNYGYSDGPFVGVALSGGGSRSAVFSYAVLHELDRMGILKHVTVLSTVSGGSIAGAHYALYGPKLGDGYWPFARAELTKDIRDRWIEQYFSPWNLGWSFLSSYNKTDALAETYDNLLFHGSTYADLGPAGPGRPELLINATAINSPPVALADISTRINEAPNIRFNGFTFSVDSFNALGSMLNSYPLARAVAASSAFPLVFNPTTLAQFSPDTLDTFAKRTNEGIENPLGYIHLIDGGVSDNLGVDALLLSAVANKKARHLNNEKREDACLLIVVDADIDRGEHSEAFENDLRTTPIDYIIDNSASYALSALFSRRREDALRTLGINLSDRHGYNYKRSASDVSVSIGQNGWYGGPGVAINSKGHPNDTNSITCTTWHIALHEILGFDVTPSTEEVRKKLYKVVNNIDTDLKLTGVGACSTDFIADRLEDAAAILVNDDKESRLAVCEWFNKNNINLARVCDTSLREKQTPDFDITPVSQENGHSSDLVTCPMQNIRRRL